MFRFNSQFKIKITAFFLAILAFILVSCGEKPNFKNVDITGCKAFAGQFSLLDSQGKTKTLADYQGKLVVLFFGYTHCPDVCPITLQEMQTVMVAMGPLADRVQVIFVSLDPQRDTPELMAQYPAAFDPRFIGLRPESESALTQLAKDFKIYFNRVPGHNPQSYTIDHTAGSYVFDTEGRLRLYIKHGQGPDPIAHDLKQLLL